MSRSFVSGVVATLALSGWCGIAAAGAQSQSAAAAIDVEALGPRVGDTVPPFSLPDQRGTARTLTSIMGPKGAILVFFRSADW